MSQRHLAALILTAAAIAAAGCGSAATTTARTTPAATSAASAAPLSAAQVAQRYGLQVTSSCGTDASLGITACVTAYDPAITAADGISAAGVKVLAFADQASRDAWLADWTAPGRAAVARGAWWLILREG